jgi:hypothetical protein
MNPGRKVLRILPKLKAPMGFMAAISGSPGGCPSERMASKRGLRKDSKAIE